MKKILFMVINMNVGGTEKALLNMVSAFPKDKFKITILMLEKHGDFLNYIPEGIRVEYVKGYKNIKHSIIEPLHSVVLGHFKKGNLIKASIVLLCYLSSKLMKERSLYYRYILREFPVIQQEYDIAVAYAGPMDFISYYVTNKIKAKKRIQWIHFDVNKIGFNKFFAAKMYKKIDKIFVVSEEGKERLLKKLPSLINKTDVFSNVVSQELIEYQAEEGKGFRDTFDGIRILTVGRLSYEKGQDLAIQALTKLIHNGYKVKWYCIGDGKSRVNYEKLITNSNVSDHFKLLGSDPNPYPYIKDCDIYVQPSRHEGYCITLAEARCLNKPIITTDFTGANEQIKNGVTGLIVNCDANEIYKAIVNLINDPVLRNELTSNLAGENINTNNEVKKIVNMQ
ncbi:MULTISPECIES: glycosyltransferase [Peribacillus]|uniref:glycosyltransferase n=1 Tax=Peribacillus TaxID=2675229 RepID=UPI001F4E0EF0|nr:MULTISPECIES: glycosyltransferase [unclassified Peribacillus]MCK1983020.1 glycosyltransferase [Peribacillus sp. Aquil_B1]MCK2011098.1 glycosyltransferase [Peribacillus sp. Aquil_B8]